MKELTPEKIEELAVELRQFLIDNELWEDATIYFNQKAFSSYDIISGLSYNNDPSHLIVLEDQDPRNVTEYTGDILTMSFEGVLAGVLNYTYSDSEHPNVIEDGLNALFAKYGLYYTLGELWNLTLHRLSDE